MKRSMGGRRRCSQMSMSARAQEEGRRYSGVCWWNGEDEEYKSAAVGALGSQSGNTTLCSLCPPLP